MRIRIEFDLSRFGWIGMSSVINESCGQQISTWEPIEGSKRYRTFVEIPDMPEVTEVKAESVEEVKP